MRRSLAAATVLLVAILAFATSGVAAPAGSSCSVSPNPATVGSIVAVSATNLPTIAPDYLIVHKPDGGSFIYHDPNAGSYPGVLIDADGNATSYPVVDQAGTWTFEYSGMVKDHGKYAYTSVATCSVQVN